MSQSNSIPAARVIAFNYVLKNTQGEVLDKSEPNQPLPFLEGRQQIIPALERVVALMSEGDKKQVTLTPEEAYGEFRQDMIMEVPKEELAHIQLEIGAHLQLQLDQQVKVVKVAKISDTHVTLDGNHPLAGVGLVFDIEVMLVRQATQDELKHGHAHGLHGHAHHH
ncbi:MAG: peptidylprolyl isomerase [Bdellovibrionales bacterium RIFCSPHIGHO2_01_FULL_40_29]|nr:MAG: peptidylprolyl isomerase [Bdellovibrionales bacterium RIFCSPHIGHO2_01_FULL_40_29]OFZ32899.1 MAG: peptidylprolyl isomerase [Bdellovibrionales bacterium RIFCSPHIGHO2_02_FULL_40_15]